MPGAWDPGEKGPGGALWGATQPLPPPETLVGPISTGVVARGIPMMGWHPHTKVQPRGDLGSRFPSVGGTCLAVPAAGPGAGSADASWRQITGGTRAAPLGVWLGTGLQGAMGCRGPPAVWGVPPLFPAPAAFALGRGEQHWLPSPSWDSREGVRAAWVPVVVGGYRLPWAGQWAGVSVARGDVGAAPCLPW